MGIWRLEEARLIQWRTASSAAGGLFLGVASPGVPEGKIWNVIGFGYQPDVAETQVVSVEKLCPTGFSVSLLNPVSLNLNPAVATFIEQGMEVTMYPGELLIVRRVAATAGSIMNAWLQFIETDLPLYTYDEPQRVKKQVRAISTIRQRLAGGGSVAPGGGGIPPLGHGSTGGGGGGSIPV